MKVLLVFLLLCLTACTPSISTPVVPALVARASVVELPAEHALQFHVESNLPLSSAQLVYGADDGRTARAVPLSSDARSAFYRLTLPEAGLPLPRGLDALRYSWTLRSSDGQSITLSQAVSSPQFLRDQSPVELRWQSARTGRITLHYLPETPAARDIAPLLRLADDTISHVQGVLDSELRSPLDVYLLPRIFWQGGAAFGDKTLFISYADRPFTGVSARDYFVHEGTHALTQDWGNLGAIGGLLAEGIAVYASGGHYQPDLLDASAASLVQSPLYIPLAILRRDFSNQQHEIAYTESGSFVKFLIERDGLEKFRALVRRPNDWRAVYAQDFDVLVQEWLTKLRAIPPDEYNLRRWPLKVRYYDLLRRYEERFDPSARRLPSVPVSRWDASLREALSTPADGEDNRVLEMIMVGAIEAIENTRRMEQLDLAEKYLDEIEQKVRTPNAPDGVVMQEVRALVRLVQAQDRAVLDRDWDGLHATLDAEGAPQFAASYIAQAAAMPAWLRFTQSPARLTLQGTQAWLTVAQWSEPLAASASAAPNGERWVLALQKQAQGWKLIGRWPDAASALMAAPR